MTARCRRRTRARSLAASLAAGAAAVSLAPAVVAAQPPIARQASTASVERTPRKLTYTVGGALVGAALYYAYDRMSLGGVRGNGCDPQSRSRTSPSPVPPRASSPATSATRPSRCATATAPPSSSGAAR